MNVSYLALETAPMADISKSWQQLLGSWHQRSAAEREPIYGKPLMVITK